VSIAEPQKQYNKKFVK